MFPENKQPVNNQILNNNMRRWNFTSVVLQTVADGLEEMIWWLQHIEAD